MVPSRRVMRGGVVFSAEASPVTLRLRNVRSRPCSLEKYLPSLITRQVRKSHTPALFFFFLTSLSSSLSKHLGQFSVDLSSDDLVPSSLSNVFVLLSSAASLQEACAGATGAAFD